jgi:hypothetical protein
MYLTLTFVFLLDFVKSLTAAMGKLFPYIRKDFVQTAHAMTFIVTLLGSFKYFLVLKLTFTWEPVFPIIIAAPRYFEDLAHLLNREYGAMFLDKFIGYFRLLVAKMAAAFFNIATDSSKSVFLRFSALNSASSSIILALSGDCLFLSSPNQFLRVCGFIPRSFATLATDLPFSLSYRYRCFLYNRR